MNHFLTIKSIRLWDPVPRTVAGSPSGIQPSFGKRAGEPSRRRKAGRPAGPWANSAGIFPPPGLRRQVHPRTIKWLLCHLPQKQRSCFFFRRTLQRNKSQLINKVCLNNHRVLFFYYWSDTWQALLHASSQWVSEKPTWTINQYNFNGSNAHLPKTALLRSTLLLKQTFIWCYRFD